MNVVDAIMRCYSVCQAIVCDFVCDLKFSPEKIGNLFIIYTSSSTPKPKQKTQIDDGDDGEHNIIVLSYEY